MTEAIRTEPAAGGQGRSAVGRLTLLVAAGAGTEKVTYERRWQDSDEARRWCEAKLADAPQGTVVLEIQVTEEVWGRRHAWEATASRHIPETLQLGLRTSSGSVTWGEQHGVGS
jgi:hypothetical protein